MTANTHVLDNTSNTPSEQKSVIERLLIKATNQVKKLTENIERVSLSDIDQATKKQLEIFKIAVSDLLSMINEKTKEY